jgi:lysyl-tRNA synthetase class 2
MQDTGYGMLALRDQLHRAIRSFFQERDYLEVYTPIRVKTPAMESHMDALEADGLFLRTSPEAHMKRLLCAGVHQQFQLGPCFRKDEMGDLHHPEFTLLEWYRCPADYLDLMTEARELLLHCAKALSSATLPDGEWPIYTVEELFRTHCNWNPLEQFDADRFNLDWVEKIEPALPKKPAFVKDFPIELAAMAQVHSRNPRVAERWELYWQGLELANAYGELMDAPAMRARFETWAEERKERGQPVYALDEAFLKALETPLPPTAGIALGVERLMMAIMGAKSLDELLPFREG